MSYTTSTKVKPDVLVEAAAEALSDKLVISNTVTKRNDTKKFFSAEGDTISQRVKGTLPVRQYDPRNDRAEPIRTDTYHETKVDITLDAKRWTGPSLPAGVTSSTLRPTRFLSSWSTPCSRRFSTRLTSA